MFVGELEQPVYDRTNAEERLAMAEIIYLNRREFTHNLASLIKLLIPRWSSWLCPPCEDTSIPLLYVHTRAIIRVHSCVHKTTQLCSIAHNSKPQIHTMYVTVLTYNKNSAFGKTAINMLHSFWRKAKTKLLTKICKPSSHLE